MVRQAQTSCTPTIEGNSNPTTRKAKPTATTTAENIITFDKTMSCKCDITASSRTVTIKHNENCNYHSLTENINLDLVGIERRNL
jgi:hypothetical protein